MAGYWTRHRLLLSFILCTAIALISSFLFVYPSILQSASLYNAQSVYKNTKIDFIAPEPSFEQVDDLTGTNGIERVFPFYLTKTPVNVNGKTRTTMVLLSDRLGDTDFTMYNQDRLIDQSKTEYDNPILVDWQFCHDTSSGIGDTVSFSIGGTKTEYIIYAVYETNSVYDGGAILAGITDEQRNVISQQSDSKGYSGMYISADDYNTCKNFLTTEYRPLGRLKDRDQFASEEQYQIHYDAIMSTGYANEITDFRVKESTGEKKSSALMIWLGALLSGAVLLAFNRIMAMRGCEKIYFTKHCLPKGQSVKSYYYLSFAFELFVTIIIYTVSLLLSIRNSKEYIPLSAIGISTVIVPVAIIIAEIICLALNNSLVAEMTRTVELELKKKKVQASNEDIVEGNQDARGIVPDK